MKKQTNQHGFTLIELMAATTVFALVLLMASSVVIQVGKLYYKGVITTKTQDTARTVTDDIARTIQFTNLGIQGPVNQSVTYGTGPSHPTVQALCVGQTRYTFALNAQVNDSVTEGAYYTSTDHHMRHALWRDSTTGACATVDLTKETPSPNGKELLAENMRLVSFNVTPTSNNFYTVTIGVLYGDDDLINNPNNPQGCRFGVIGSEWCAQSIVSAQVLRRITGN